MVEHDASRTEVVRKGERSKVEVAQEEKIEAILAQEAARASTPSSKSASTGRSDGIPEAYASIEAREDELLATKATTELPRSAEAPRGVVVNVENESTHGVSVESTQGALLAASHAIAPSAEGSNASTVSAGRESALSVTEPIVSATEAVQSPYSGEERSSTVHDDVLEGSDSGMSVTAPSKRARKLRKGDEARMRQLLLQQLMDQHTTKARREKILKALIALGISEVEYRKLLVKLGEMDAARLAEQVAARTKTVEPIAMTVDAPAMKESENVTTSPATNRSPETKPQTTRAALYKRIKEESATARK